jgi:hypothetical protein
MGDESQIHAAVLASRGTTGLEVLPELGRELLEAIAEIDRGECIELSREQLERCIVDGEWPWPNESPG